VVQEPRGLRECAGKDGVDGGSPKSPGVDEVVQRLDVAGLDGGEVLVTVGGELAYILQPREKGREVRDTPRRKKKERSCNGGSHPERWGGGALTEFDEGQRLRCTGMARRGRVE
jgi:hypothetical protein